MAGARPFRRQRLVCLIVAVLGLSGTAGSQHISRAGGCELHRYSVVFSGGFMPRCTPDGNYEPLQCYGGQCWCVRLQSGTEISGSRRPKHLGEPSCRGTDPGQLDLTQVLGRRPWVGVDQYEDDAVPPPHSRANPDPWRHLPTRAFRLNGSTAVISSLSGLLPVMLWPELSILVTFKADWRHDVKHGSGFLFAVADPQEDASAISFGLSIGYTAPVEGAAVAAAPASPGATHELKLWLSGKPLLQTPFSYTPGEWTRLAVALRATGEAEVFVGCQMATKRALSWKALVFPESSRIYIGHRPADKDATNVGPVEDTFMGSIKELLISSDERAASRQCDLTETTVPTEDAQQSAMFTLANIEGSGEAEGSGEISTVGTSSDVFWSSSSRPIADATILSTTAPTTAAVSESGAEVPTSAATTEVSVDTMTIQVDSDGDTRSTTRGPIGETTVTASSTVGEANEATAATTLSPISEAVTTAQVNIIKGEKGEKGETGVGQPGPQGPPGNSVVGRPGERGPKGDKGDLPDVSDLVGPPGPPGSQGPLGPVGPTGPEGPRGPPGVPGPPGQPGLLLPPIRHFNESGIWFSVDGEPEAESSEAGNDTVQILRKRLERLRGPKGEPGEPCSCPALVAPGSTWPTNSPDNRQGPPGAPGEMGPSGQPGERGPKGDQGSDGRDGQPGLAGERGAPGEKGSHGSAGLPGPPGPQGPPGPSGPGRELWTSTPPSMGEKGEKGARGLPGVCSQTCAGEGSGEADPLEKRLVKGPRGDRGEPGDQGPKGDRGEPGEKGIIGMPGFPGRRGDAGIKGDVGQGVKGDKGDLGPAGPAGRAPEVAELAEAVIHILKERGLALGGGGDLSPTPSGGHDIGLLNVVHFANRRDMLASSADVGMICYVTDEDAMFARMRAEWRQITLGEAADSDRGRTTTAELEETVTAVPPPPWPTAAATTDATADDETAVHRGGLHLIAIRRPMSGNTGGEYSVERECFMQAREAGFRTTFRPLRASNSESLVSIVAARDRLLPVVNVMGQQLANSWRSLTEKLEEGQYPGRGGALGWPVYSFDGRNVLTDSRWPSKCAWIGIRGRSCNDWKTTNSVGSVLSLLNPATNPDGASSSSSCRSPMPCDEPLAVLCIEVSTGGLRK